MMLVKRGFVNFSTRLRKQPYFVPLTIRLQKNDSGESWPTSTKPDIPFIPLVEVDL